jgi:hypothetical protein
MARVHAAPAVPVTPILQINQARYRDGLNQFVNRLGADAQLLLKEEMRLLLREVVRFTPPKTSKQGRNAVGSDLAKNAAPLDPATIKWPRLAELARKRDIAGIEALTKNITQGFWARRKMLNSTSQIADEHRRNRTRYGRIRTDKRNMAMLAVWNRYTREVQSRVGFAKAGWVTAAKAVGLPMPSWVTRLAGAAGGGYVAPTINRLVIEAINRSTKIPNYEQNVVFAAVRSRAMSIESELKRILGGGKTRRASLAHTIHGQPASK